MNIGFIGFGEAGFELAKGLFEEGIQAFVYDKSIEEADYKELLKKRVEEAQVKLVNCPEEIFRTANLIFVAVPSKNSLSVCKSVHEYIESDIIYVDVSASSPSIKKEMEEIIKDRDGKFVDGAMLGPLTVYKHKVPMVASGNGARVFINQMNSYGMNIKYISDKAGDASSIKLLRSIYMKGIAALLVELLEAARFMNIEKDVIESLRQTMEASNFENIINQLITGTAIHSTRRVSELEESLKMLSSSNLNSNMTLAAIKKLEYVSQLNLKGEWMGERPEKWEIVIDKILERNKESEHEYH